MNNITIAILLSDIILLKIFEEISKNFDDQLTLKIISYEDNISNYSVIITDTINLSKLNNDYLSDHQKILCIGEKSNFDNDINIKSEISYLNVPFKFSELKERAENFVKVENENVEKKLKSSGIDSKLYEFSHLSKLDILTLVENDIKTLDDLADLDSEELFTLLGKKVFNNENEAGEIIMEARKHWFDEN